MFGIFIEKQYQLKDIIQNQDESKKQYELKK